MLDRLLALHEGPLLRAGLALADLDASAVWDARDRLPDALLETLHDLHAMSDDFGHGQLVAVARRHGHPLPARALPVQLAALLRVERPDLFHEAHARQSVEATRPFYEFVGRALVAPSQSETGLRKLEAELRRYFEGLGLGDHCHVQTWQDGDLHAFLIARALCPRADREVRDSRMITREWQPVGHDLVVFDRRTGRLRIGARERATRKEYLRGFGTWWFQDPTWFGEGEVVSLEPLLASPTAALAPVSGLTAVRLVEIELVNRRKHSGKLVSSGDDAFGVLDDFRIAPGRDARLRAARFELQRASGRTCSVRVVTPNRISGDWRSERVARRFLEERGFLAGPPEQAA